MSNQIDFTDERRYAKQRELMVKSQIRSRGVEQKEVLDALLKVPRHLFVPEHLRESAYSDQPLPIGLGQTISQPYIVAYMTELLELYKEAAVLEIGTGSGYQAAVLAEIASKVFTIELEEYLYEGAKGICGELGYTNIEFYHGDGYLGWPEHAPLNRIG